jgi:hypothetical protein
LHSTQDIRSGRDGTWIALVISLALACINNTSIAYQNNHVLLPETISLSQELHHIMHIVDAAAQLALRAKVVDTNQQGLLLSMQV